MKQRVLMGVLGGVAILSAASADVRASGSQLDRPGAVAASPVPQLALTATPQQRPTGGAASVGSPQQVLVNRYCVTCHNGRTEAGGLVLGGLDVAKPSGQAEVWEKVIGKLRAGMMPPPNRPRPDAATLEGFVAFLETEIDRAAAADPSPGRTETFHRLNRTEYRNVVRDLLAVDVDVTALLPPDEAGYGFDNIASALRLSESLMERYLAVARRISRLAVGSPPAAVVAETFTVSPFLRQYERAEGLGFGTRGGMLVRYNFPQDASYDFTVAMWCNSNQNPCDPRAGFEDRHDLEITIDGERVHVFSLEPKPSRGNYSTEAVQRLEVRVPVSAGLHEVGVTFLRLPSYEPTDRARLRFLKPSYEGNMVPGGMGVYQPHVRSVTMTGPFDATGVSETASRRRIFVCRPASAAEEASCAQQILSTLAKRAYRRPVTNADVAPLLAFYEGGRRRGGFEAGIELALNVLLVSPQFLFRVEAEPRTVAAQGGTTYRLSDMDVASRLSFFLWSSLPDDELIDLAAKGELQDPAVLDRQVRRMLADDRAAALTEDFLPQWLQLRRLGPLTPDVDLFPNFDESLKAAFLRETELFFDSIMREDRSVLEMLTANYTFVNERLATHYGIPNVQGSHFRRVTLTEDSPRRGLLGHGSILTLTSHQTRTSPVVRGKWVLDTILGSPPPAPPPNVPPLAEQKGGERPKGMRERMAVHRSNPVCASCHTMIDPAGFALENFDPVGQWRDVEDSGEPIDASGALPDGTAFGGLSDFRAALTSHPERFVTALTERLMTYALGRGVEYYDMPAIRAITREAEQSDYRFSALIVGIVKSIPFQWRSVASPSTTVVAGAGP